MRQYYASDKKRREDAKKKLQAEKRMKKVNKSQKQETKAEGTTVETSGLPGAPMASKSSVTFQQAHSRMNIRMSKISRILKSEMARTNWTDMAKMLFRRDADLGRRQMSTRLASAGRPLSSFEKSIQDKTTDQMQHFLVLMFVLTIAEKRSQEVYEKEFSKRCDAISSVHGLNEREYWNDGQTPPEWAKLDAEFEQRSIAIFQDTLREYSMNEIADRIATGGTEEFINLISSMETQVKGLLESH